MLRCGNGAQKISRIFSFTKLSPEALCKVIEYWQVFWLPQSYTPSHSQKKQWLGVYTLFL